MFPMAAGQIRVRLDFSEPLFKCSFDIGPESCWMLIDRNTITSIKYLKETIKTRFLGNNKSHFDLYLCGGLLPDFESIHLIRDGDVLRLIPSLKRKSARKRKYDAPPTTVHREDDESTSKLSSNTPKSVEIPSEMSATCAKKQRTKSNDLPLANFTASLRQDHESPTKHGNYSSRSVETPASTSSSKMQCTKPKDLSSANCTPELQVPDAVLCSTAQLNVSKTNCLNSELEKSSAALEVSSLLGSDTESFKSFQSGSKKKKRTRKRKKRSPRVLAEGMTEKQQICTSFQNSTPKNSQNKHIHFPLDDNERFDKNVEKETQVGNTEELNESLIIRPTMLPPSNLKYEQACQDLLQRAKTESQTNPSVILLNCTEDGGSSHAPQVPAMTKSEGDYQSLPSLKGLPSVGDVIAYKVLELSDKFIPELSSYKEAVVMEIDNKNEVLTVEVKAGKVQRVLKGEEGGYDMVIQDDVRNIRNSSEKMVKVQVSHIHEARIIEKQEPSA